MTTFIYTFRVKPILCKKNFPAGASYRIHAGAHAPVAKKVFAACGLLAARGAAAAAPAPKKCYLARGASRLHAGAAAPMAKIIWFSSSGAGAVALKAKSLAFKALFTACGASRLPVLKQM